MGATSVQQADITLDANVKEKLTNSVLDDKYVTHRIRTLLQMTSATTPDAELIYSTTQALSGGSATIDLKSISNTEGTTIVTDGKKVRAFAAKATSTNENALTLTEGASNGYELMGDGWKVALEASDSFLVVLNDNAPAIGDSAKTIDLSGTLSESVDILIIFG
jgi:hypothetical protein